MVRHGARESYAAPISRPFRASRRLNRQGVPHPGRRSGAEARCRRDTGPTEAKLLRHHGGMDRAWAQKFVDSWEQGWNAHDLERVLSHFADDVVFTSPVAAQLLGDSDGVIRGKAALREYWTEGLRRIPDLRF